MKLIISLNNYIIKDIINSFPTKYINISHLDDTIWINKSYLRINISRSGKNVINNHTKIDVLEDCENKLKEYYNIPENASLIKLIFEKKEEGTNSFKPEYEIRYLLNGSYIKLDTSICNNIIEDINNKIPTFSLQMIFVLLQLQKIVLICLCLTEKMIFAVKIVYLIIILITIL